MCNNLLKFAVSLLIICGAQTAVADICWKESYGRGVGTIPKTCKFDQAKSGLLCYSPCKPNYTLVAGICWQNCSNNFKDTGAHCLKPQSYGRGAGYALWDQAKCERENKTCEKSGLMWYPKCKAGFHAVGCCVCSPDCPPGTKDIGVSCEKNSYIVPPIAPNCGNRQYDTGLCYDACKNNFYGIGPVCWSRCPQGMVDCGAMCGSSLDECLSSISEMVISVGSVVAKAAAIISTFGAATGVTAATEAAKTSAINALKETAKKIAKDIAKKLAKSTFGELKPLIANELRKIPNLPSFLVEKLSDMAAGPDTFDYMAFIKGLDPTGIANVVDAFNKKICGK